MPSSSAVSSVNGLIEEPGWRCPWVARLNGAVSKFGPADHRLDRGVAVVDHDHRGGRGQVAEVGVDRFFGAFLQRQVERRLDLEAAEEGLLGPIAFDQLLAQEGGEVGRLGVDLRRFDAARRRQRLLQPFGQLLVGDVALFGHLFQHQVAASQRVFGIGLRVVGRGRGDDPRQGRRLPGLEHRGAGLGVGAAARMGGAEVGAGGGLDPVGALAEVDRVEVLGEDLVLAPVALEAVGERRLAELLEDRAAAFGVERVLDELLGDRRGALGGALAEDVLDQGAPDALEVDAAVFVEARVLDRHHRVLDVGGDLSRGEEDLVLIAGQGAERFAVGADHFAVLGGLELGEVVDRGQVLGDRGHHPEDHRDDGEDAEAEQDEEEAQLLQLRLAALRRGRRGGGRHRRDLTAAALPAL